MVATYVYHSCCALQFEDFSIIIDYYKDTDANNHGWVHNHLLKQNKPLYVLCTHSHADHFNDEVFLWKAHNNRITYIFSDEVRQSLPHNKALASNDIVFLEKLEEYRDNRIAVQAFGSTDIGGSFYITHGNKKIFHAGDLNNWHWNEEVTKEETYVYENHYICELELLWETVKEVDLAMFPLDPRLGKDFMRGGEQFIEKIKTHHFLPLHFGNHYSRIEEFKPIAQKLATNLLELTHTGQSFTL